MSASDGYRCQGRHGRHWKWSKGFRDVNYFQQHASLSDTKWKKYYGCLSRDFVLFFFDLIEPYFMKPKDTWHMKLNKLLFWLNYLHSDQETWFSFSRKWGDICEASAGNYMMDVVCAILRAFASTPDIISFASHDDIELMKNILTNSRASIPIATYLVDGKCTRVLGRKGEHQKLCHKFKNRPNVCCKLCIQNSQFVSLSPLLSIFFPAVSFICTIAS